MKSKALRIGSFLVVLAATAAGACGAWWYAKLRVAQRVGALAAATPRTAPTAMRELASLDAAAVAPLLDAAVNPDRTIAEPARRELELLVRRWASQSTPSATRGASNLLVRLLARDERLTPSGRRWARHLADTVLELIDADPARDAALVALCDQLYEAAFDESTVRDLPLVSPPRARRQESASPPLAGRATPPITAQAPPPHSPPPAQHKPPAPTTPATSANPPPVDFYVSERERSAPPPTPLVTDALPPESPLQAFDGADGLGWRAPTQANPLRAAASPTRKQEPQPLDPPTHAAAPDTTPEGVRATLEGDEAERMELVNQLLTGRHAGAPELLLKLARDPSPRVRASAISALGSSQDRRLTEAAWRLAMRDKDPRVARLARELQKLLR